MELAVDLQAMRAGKLAWSDIDHKGLLLSGPPGTGKTTFAAALANEAGVPLVATSVADWTRADHLGVTQEKMRKAFVDAMAQAPSILFIDELDGIADRSNLSGHGAEYWTHVVNALLELLAGVEDRDGVVVIGASNHPHKIDAAILRAGRLDRHIGIPLPDLAALVQILRFHLHGDLTDADLKPVAASLLGQTGADVEAAVRRARGQARRRGRPLTVDDLREVIAADGLMNAAHLQRVALHEAGHALVASLKGRRIEHAAIHQNGGVVSSSDEGAPMDIAQLEATMVVALAGRAAEEHVFGARAILAGGEADLLKSTDIALMIETRLGLGQGGLMHLGVIAPFRLMLEPDIRRAVSERLNRCHAEALRLIAADEDALQAIAADLAARGYLTGDDVEAAIARGRGIKADAGPRKRKGGAHAS
jgi:ATP-dependent Zn protease